MLKSLVQHALKLSLVPLFLSVFAFGGYAENPAPLPVNQAFVFSSQTLNSKEVLLHWQIAPNYRLYQDKLKIRVAPDSKAQIGPVNLPNAQEFKDAYIGKYSGYEKELSVIIPVVKGAGQSLTLDVSYQGCFGKTYCYAPQDKTLLFDLRDSGVARGKVLANNGTEAPVPFGLGQGAEYLIMLKNASLFALLAAFFGLGVLLALTPCIFPMIPVLLSLVMRKSHPGRLGALLLSSAYAIGIGLAYAIVGIAAGFLGRSLQQALQTPVAIILMAFLFVLLAISMFGAFKMELPNRWRARINTWMMHQKGGHLLGAMAMGMLSALIVSPCISPPLIGVMTYVAATGNVMLSTAALFVMGVGMGVPLIVLGTFGAHVLPKAGHWMIQTQKFLALLLLVVALWLVSRFIAHETVMALLLLWAFLCAQVMGVFTNFADKDNPIARGFVRIIGAVILFYGVSLMVATMSGNSAYVRTLLFQPPIVVPEKTEQQQRHDFITVTDEQALKRVLIVAKSKGEPVILDYYASWCLACVEQTYHVLPDPQVRASLKPFVKVRVDISANNAETLKLQQHYAVMAPPTIIWLDRHGQVVSNATLVGEVGPERIVESATLILSRP